MRTTLAVVTAVLLLASLVRAENAPVAYSAKDTAGNAVNVPATSTSVLLFLRPGQQQSDEELKAIVTLAKSRKNLRVVTFVSGENAPLDATNLANAHSPFPVVADPDYAASGKFSVRVWPTTLVVSSGGQQIVHIAGYPANLETALTAYLDFADQKIDKAGLEKLLADRTVVADTTDQKASRHIEVAQRLVVHGMPDDARKELANALELKPTDQTILLSIVRTQLMIGDAQPAQTLLGELRDPNLPSGELNFLRGWAALQLGKFDESKQILSQSVMLNPDPAESLYLLGKIADHDGDAKAAADYYRRAFEHTELGKAINVAK